MALVAIVAMAVSPTSLAYTGGVVNSDLSYDCGGSCHSAPSASVMEMCASCVNPTPGETVTVTVNVTGAECVGLRLGVMLVASLHVENSLPSDENWTILSDPSGFTAYNYYQIEACTGEVSLTWSLKAPPTSGVKMLYAREMHGGGGMYSNDYMTGLLFTIGEAPQHECIPNVIVTSPAEGEKVYGDMTVCANVQSTKQLSYCLLKVDGEPVQNFTSGPYAWTIDTTKMEDGTHIINITAVDADGHIGSYEFVIEVNNDGERALYLSWLATMASGSMLIVAVSGLAITGALFYRSRSSCRKVK